MSYPVKTDFNYEDFRLRLGSLMASHGLNRSELSDATGIARPTVSRYLSGDRQPDLPYIIKLAEYFNVSIDWLLGIGEDRYEKMPADVVEFVRLYSLATPDDRMVIKAVLQKYKEGV